MELKALVYSRLQYANAEDAARMGALYPLRHLSLESQRLDEGDLADLLATISVCAKCINGGDSLGVVLDPGAVQ